MITPEDIVKAELPKLKQYYKYLHNYVEALDRFYENFEQSIDLNREDKESPAWEIYKGLVEEYDNADSLIRSTNYYLGKHSQHSRIQNTKRLLPTHREHRS